MATEQRAQWVLDFKDQANPKLLKLEDAFRDVDHQANKTGNRIDDFGRKAKGLQANFVGLGSVARTLGGYFAGAFAVGTINDFGRTVVSQLSEFEKFQVVLANTYGSTGAAKEAMQAGRSR